MAEPLAPNDLVTLGALAPGTSTVLPSAGIVSPGPPPVLSGGLKLTGFPPVPFTVASATNVFP